MKNNILKIASMIFFGCLIFSFSFANAASSPQFLISWKAYNYTPDWYQGKSFPIYSTPVEVAFELIDNNKIANLSKNEIRWYINDALFTKGVGLKNIRFTPTNQAGSNISIRIAIQKYNNGELNKFIYIPSKNPEAIISSPYLTKNVILGNNYQFEVFPFFFNVSSLNNINFGWTVNNQISFIGEDEISPDILNLNISTSTPSGLTLNINATVSNILQSIESVTKDLKLTVQ